MQKFVHQPQVLMPVSGNRLPQPSHRGAFVVNLGSSSTPVALSSPEHAELKKFTFFVSRRREEGRERFRLHMGYFDTQQDADSLLPIVREIYPGAWAGVAPGRKAPEGAPPLPVAAPVAAAKPVSAPPPADVQVTTLMLDLEPEPPPSTDEHFAASQSLSSVRAAIASLEDGRSGGEPLRREPTRPAVSKADVSPVVSKPELSKPEVSRSEDSQLVATLSQTQTLHMLEATASMRMPGSSTLAREAIAAYAVQLRSSAKPIVMAELPRLAIFSAYTLYRAKGRHDGIYWHALRLGFFQEQSAANQVATYIRPEFGAVTVVPVGVAERDSALAAAASRAAATKAAAKPARPEPAPAAIAAAAAVVPSGRASANLSVKSGQFKLIEDDVQPTAEPSKLEMMLTSDAKPAPAPAPGKGGADKGKPGVRRPPENLEETLDLLGAGKLKLDSSKGEMLDATGMRRMRHAAERKPAARSALSRLFDRLAENIGGGR